jgi:hypothetical protein
VVFWETCLLLGVVCSAWAFVISSVFSVTNAFAVYVDLLMYSVFNLVGLPLL